MDTDDAHRQAIAMLNAFASVGASRFDVTWRSLGSDTEATREFRKGVPLDTLKASMPKVLDQVTRQRRNIIVRPLGPPVFLQLDDLSSEKLEMVKPAAFLTLDTSPGNHQAWLAIGGLIPEDVGSRTRKGSGADLYASGATRVAGSLNFKDKYAPDFPRVTIGEVAPGRMTTTQALEAMGLVAPAEPISSASPRVLHSRERQYRPSSGPRPWPDYQKCLDRAPGNAAGDGPKRASADYTWCLIAADWGHSLQDTVARLIEQSTKAQENGKGYALKTARKAAAAAAQNQGKPSTKPATQYRR